MKQGNTALAGIGSRKDAHVAQRIDRFEDGAFTERVDAIIQEAAIEVFVDGQPRFSATCSPWDFEELVVGRLYLEGIIFAADHLAGVDVDPEHGRVDVRLRPYPASLQRGSGVVLAFDDLRCRFDARTLGVKRGGWCASDLRVSAQTISASAAMLEKHSLLFRKTGGVHSAVLVDERGSVLAWFEDIGRHSAVDKLAGWCVMRGVDASRRMLIFSGRVPHEIIAKVAALRCPIVISPGAPTNLSIEVAKAANITLVGFAKQGRFNVYAHPERVGE